MRAIGLALTLFVFGIPLADDPDHAPALDHLAVLADRLDARSHLQKLSPGKEFWLSLEQYPGS
jgi:hypothetical protein